VVIDPVQVFLELAAISKAPYACLLKYSNRYILCASPELFLKKEGKRISTKPIKGTIRRGTHPEEDALLRDKLFNDLKERTENVMAVDVARNDLSVFASRGSVKVNRLYNIESFETVHQMVSTVSCEMKTGTGFNDMVAASFPMASMTGAPKKRAMTLIDSHEGFKRGEYSGAMGLVSSNGDFELAVIIRSIFYDSSSNSLSIAAGSAITYLSEPEDEYRECLLKAKALLTALNAKIDG
jgi:para-aminobenzoate synthetase component 1